MQQKNTSAINYVLSHEMYSASSFFCLSLNIFVGIRFATQAGEDEGTNADYQGNSHEDVNDGDGPECELV